MAPRVVGAIASPPGGQTTTVVLIDLQGLEGDGFAYLCMDRCVGLRVSALLKDHQAFTCLKRCTKRALDLYKSEAFTIKATVSLQVWNHQE